MSRVKLRRGRFAARRDLFRRLIRYGAVSMLTSLVVFSVLGVLVGVVNTPAGWSNVAAASVGIALSYELNRRWAWRDRTEHRTASQMTSFTIVNLSGVVLSTIAVHAAAVIATQHHLDRLTRTEAVEAVNFATWGALWLVQFLILDRFIFRSDPTSISTASCAPCSIDGEHVEVG